MDDFGMGYALGSESNGSKEGCGMFGNGFIWILLIIGLMFGGFGGFGFGGYGGYGVNNAAVQGALTRSDLFDGFNNQQIENGVRSIQNGLCDGFYAQNTTMLQGFNGLNNAVQQAQFNAQQCCCETNRNIDAVRYENSRNTCDIINAIREDGNQTRALINANVMQDLRDRLADKDRDVMAANFQLSQLSQNATLINALAPKTPIPAYLTSNPLEAAMQYYGYGRGCSCNGYCGA